MRLTNKRASNDEESAKRKRGWGSAASRRAQTFLRNNHKAFRTFTSIPAPSVKQLEKFVAKMDTAMQDVSGAVEPQTAEMAVRSMYMMRTVGMLYSHCHPPKAVPAKKRKIDPVPEKDERVQILE